jgi:hypothetical protein
MRTTRNALLMLMVLVALVFGGDTFARSAYCADCAAGGAVDHQCSQEELQDLNDCCQVFGCNSNWSINYCADRSKDVYNGCAVLHGCPNLVY